MQLISQSQTQEIGERLERVRAAVWAAAAEAGRSPAELCLIGVSKTQPAAAVRAAYSAGLRDFGENYVQEALDKVDACAALNATWHFIGHIQSNKTRQIAAAFDWVHTLDRVKIARRLNDHCPPGKVLQACLQINIDADPNKGGLTARDAEAALQQMHDLPRLRVRGLMTILHPDTNPTEGYQRLRKLFDDLAYAAPGTWDTLSMGMSGDYPAAVRAGATHIRVGTAIFGPRQAATGR